MNLFNQLEEILEQGNETEEDSEMEGDAHIDEDEIDKTVKKRKKRKIIKPKSVKIVPLFPNDKDYIDPPHPNLSRIPFSNCAVAEKGSGKTVALQNFLLPYLANHMFDRVYYFSPTVALDIKQKLFLKKYLGIDYEEEMEKPKSQRRIFKNYKEKEVSKIVKRIGEINEQRINDGKDKMTTLMIFDDIVESLPKNKKNSAMNKLAFNMRHYFVSFICITQYYKALDIKLRTNFTGYWLFESSSIKEKKKLVEELGGKIGEENFNDFFDYATLDKYNFLNFNKDSRKLYKNFDELLYEY